MVFREIFTFDGQALTEHDKCVMIPLIERKGTHKELSTMMYSSSTVYYLPLPPIFGEYNHMQYINNIEENVITKQYEKYFGTTIDDIVETIYAHDGFEAKDNPLLKEASYILVSKDMFFNDLYKTDFFNRVKECILDKNSYYALYGKSSVFKIRDFKLLDSYKCSIDPYTEIFKDITLNDTYVHIMNYMVGMLKYYTRIGKALNPYMYSCQDTREDMNKSVGAYYETIKKSNKVLERGDSKEYYVNTDEILTVPSTVDEYKAYTIDKLNSILSNDKYSSYFSGEVKVDEFTTEYSSMNQDFTIMCSMNLNSFEYNKLDIGEHNVIQYVDGKLLFKFNRKSRKMVLSNLYKKYGILCDEIVNVMDKHVYGIMYLELIENIKND